MSDWDADQRIVTALTIIEDYAGIDGTHHKAWVIDQILRVLTQSQYDAWVDRWEHGCIHNRIEECDDDCEQYEWDTGIAP